MTRCVRDWRGARVKKGDKVLVSKYGGTEIKLDGKDYKILNSDDILAIIN